MQDVWPSEQDRFKYASLIKHIQDSEASRWPISAFIGAGLSIQAGYPSSIQLIDYLLKAAGLDRTIIDPLDRFPAQAQKIKDAVHAGGQDFYEILYRRFDEDQFQINRTIPL